MIHQQDQTNTITGLPTPGQLMRTIGPILLLAIAAVTVVQGSISWASVATTAAVGLVALGSLLWFRAAAATPPRPPSRSASGPHGLLGWAATVLVVVVQWSICSLVLSAVARLATWAMLALTGRWPRRTDEPVAS